MLILSKMLDFILNVIFLKKKRGRGGEKAAVARIAW